MRIPDEYADTFKKGDVVNLIGDVIGINLDGNGGITVQVRATGQRLTVSRYIKPDSFDLRERPKSK